MTITDTDAKRTFDDMKCCGGADQPTTAGRDGGGSRSSSIDRGTSQEDKLCSTQSSPTSRRVHFIDEVMGDLTHGLLVTGIAFRPSTRDEEKSALYYTPQDYALFGLEAHYETDQRCGQPQQAKEVDWKFGFEDFLTVGLECCDDNVQLPEIDMSTEDKARVGSSLIHKVKTLKDLHP